MVIAEIMVPCISGSQCRLDWTAIAAVGGCIAAFVTLVAVVVALYTAHKQLSVALAIEESRNNNAEQERHRAAVRIAHAMARELGFARRHLATMLSNLEPVEFATGEPERLELFAAPNPLPQLTIVGAFSDRLDCFKLEDSLAVLSVLNGWKFFTATRFITVERLEALSPEKRESMASSRVRQGIETLDAINNLIRRLDAYRDPGAPAIDEVHRRVPTQVKAGIERIRKYLSQKEAKERKPVA